MKKEKTPEEIAYEKMKFEIAEELGFSEKILKNGWKALSSKESGKIGGIIAARKRKENEKSH